MYFSLYISIIPLSIKILKLTRLFAFHMIIYQHEFSGPKLIVFTSISAIFLFNNEEFEKQ